jgi:hypothetical protein
MGIQLREDWDYRPFLSCPDGWFGPNEGLVSAEELAPQIHIKARNYLQDYELWREIDETIHEAFTPSIPAQRVLDDEWAALNLPEPVCGIHVRRGDYVTNPSGTLNALPLEYYSNAVKSLYPRSIVIFSDDPDWCEEKMPYADSVYRGIVRPLNNDDDTEYENSPVLDWVDMFLMARCDQHIISNSSYSWWPAWYARDNETRYPGEWTGFDWLDWRRMILPGWHEIEVR